MSNRYAVMGQVFIADGTTTTDSAGRHVADKTITITGGAGNFTIYMTQGITGTVTSGTAAITGSVVTLAAGLNTLTADGNGTCTLDITIGTDANWNHVNSWSAASGGTGGASVPTSADNAYFDANSFTGASQVLTVDAAANTLDMDWTGATNTPTLTYNSTLFASGNVTFILAMSTTTTSGGQYFSGAGSNVLTTNSLTLGNTIILRSSFTGIVTLADSLNIGAYDFLIGGGTFVTAGKTVSCGSFFDAGTASVKTLTLSSSVINCTSFSITGSNLTVTANTATIKVTGTGAFAGGGITTYNNVELNGTAHTISGSNTFATLALASGTTQTITFTDGTTQTATTFTLSGSSGKIHTLQGSGVAGWNMAKAGGGNVIADYLSVSYSTVT